MIAIVNRLILVWASTASRYPLDPRLDGIFIHLTEVRGVNTSQQWSISDQVAPRPTPIITGFHNISFLVLVRKSHD
jgi:hypothetical protein